MKLRIPTIREVLHTVVLVAALLGLVILIGFGSVRANPVLLLGGIVAGAMGLIILRRPFWGLLLLAFFIPFERLGSYDIAGITVRTSQVTALLTLFAVFCSIAVQRNFRMPKIPTLIPLILYFIVGLFGLTNAVNLQRSLLVFLFTVFTCSVSVLVPLLIRTPEDLRKVLKWFFISFVIVTIFGLYQFAGDWVGLPTTLTGLRELYTKDVLGFPRVQSTALEPLYFANYLLVPLSVLISLFLMRDKSFGVKKLVALIALGGANLVLTVARGGYIAFAVSLCILLAVHFFRLFTWRNLFYVSLAGTVGLVVIVKFANLDVISTQFVSHVTDLFSGASYSERVETFVVANHAWMDHPWIGIGPGSFGPYESFHPFVVPAEGWSIVNNEYLELLAENGIFGLLAMLCVFAITIVRSVKALLFVKDPYVKAVLIGTLAGFIGILVQYNTFSILYILHIWFTIGLLVALQNMVLHNKQSS